MGCASSSPLLLLVLCLTWLFIALPCLSSIIPPLTPPPGNSLAIMTKTQNGVQLYQCVDGEWVKGCAYATLLDYNTGKVVGNYTSVPNPQVPKYVGTWTYLNNDGDQAESGSAYSVVTGKKIGVAKPKTPGDLADYLALASSHASEGALSLVSYIAQRNTVGGAKQDDGYCEVEHKVVKVPFQAEFQFWTQDLVPPTMPTALAVGAGQPIQGFYGAGYITYVNNGRQWVQRKVAAKLYDVPGGNAVGSYFTMSKPDYNGGSYCWEIGNPNGFSITGKLACKPELVSTGCLPWSLNMITSSTRNSTMFGPYTYVQMVSTTGGLPPAGPAKKSQRGNVWRSPFSAIYWFYCGL